MHLTSLEAWDKRRDDDPVQKVINCGKFLIFFIDVCV